MTEAEKTFNVDELFARLGGRASEDEVRIHFDDVDAEEFRTWGAEVATRRIHTNGVRIVGDALTFIASASEQQLDALPTVTKESLRLALSAILVAMDAFEGKTASDKSGRSKRAELGAVTEEKLGKLIAWRDVVYNANLAIGGMVAPYSTRITEAYSKAEDPASVCKSVRGQIAIARDLLEVTKPAIVARRKTTRLSSTWLETAHLLASEVDKAQKAASLASAAPHLSAGEVDLRDGWALVLLDDVITGFDRGHRLDGTIPRLNTYGLRSVLRPRRSKKPAPIAPPAEPIPTT